MPWLEPVTLRGEHARLEPLSQNHCDGLVEAVKDGELWKLWYTFVPKPEDMSKEIERRLGLTDRIKVYQPALLIVEDQLGVSEIAMAEAQR